MDAPERTCAGCMGSDQAPKHIIDVGGGSEIAWHMDCHSASRPSCESCTDVMSRSHGAKNEKLRVFLTA